MPSTLDDSPNNHDDQGIVSQSQANMGDRQSSNCVMDNTGNAGQQDDGTSNSGPREHLEGDIDGVEHKEGDGGAEGGLEGPGSLAGHSSEDGQQEKPKDNEDEYGNGQPPRGPPEGSGVTMYQ
ncbi:hypothetical protein BDN71DRAFT_1513341 [Pleurotus eryngii]|uniref:Uncharacterized protein n=1 Tax=Pleurotus eryngii TaxID=5323 RepID=A0A9P5ZIQ1_PLEER|nr:hypothetical protein BDN71DRAFT_1513341 [Pleurotus eryngii]